MEHLNTLEEKLEYFINLLIARATGDEKVSNAEFFVLREELLQDADLKDIAPSFVKTHASIQSFWSFIKGKFGKFDERRSFINSEFQAARDYLATGILPSSATPSLSRTKEFVKQGIKDYFQTYGVLKNIYGEFNLTSKNIGNGGTSEVKGFNLNGYEYAIKFLHENIASSETSAFLRFKQAHLNILELQHLGVVLPQLHMDKLKISEDLVIPYVIMPIAEKTLKEWWREEQKNDHFCIDTFENIFNELLEIIQTLHDNGVIHRDIKPENIFIYKSKLVLGDFDIAKFDDSLYLKLIETKPKDRLANYSFSAPEQVAKNGKVTEASDWYALGQVLHWLLFNKTLRGQQRVDLSEKGDSYHIYSDLINKLLSEDPKARPCSKEKIKNILLEQKIPKRLSKEQTLDEFEEIFFKYMPDLGMNGTDIRQFSASDDVQDIMSFIAENIDRFNMYWSKGYSDNHIRKLQHLEGEGLWLLYPYELKVKAVWLFKHYYNLGCSLIVLEVEGLDPTGVYENHGDIDYEEYAVLEEHKFSRKEFDSGWTIIDSVRTKLNGNAEIKVRPLKDDIFFIAPYSGPLVRNIELIDKLYNKFKETRVLSNELLEPLKSIKKDYCLYD